jgi:hypothetical protein
MKKRYVLFIFFPLLAIISAFVIFFNLRLNPKWVTEDEAMIEEILPILYDIPNIDILINNFNFKNEFYPYVYKRELGLGYSITNLVRYGGGYTSISIKLLADSNDISYSSKLTIKSNKRVMKRLDKKYKLSDLYESNTYSGQRYSYVTINSKNVRLYDEFINDFNNYFKINTNINIPDEIVSEYRLLTEPFYENVYGYRIGFGGIIPRERKALEKILELNDNNILMAIISSPNPEGRLYAIEGLIENNTDDILYDYKFLDIVDKTIELNCAFSVGRYCVISSKKINSLDEIQKLINDIKIDVDAPIE